MWYSSLAVAERDGEIASCEAMKSTLKTAKQDKLMNKPKKFGKVTNKSINKSDFEMILKE